MIPAKAGIMLIRTLADLWILLPTLFGVIALSELGFQLTSIEQSSFFAARSAVVHPQSPEAAARKAIQDSSISTRSHFFEARVNRILHLPVAEATDPLLPEVFLEHSDWEGITLSPRDSR